MLTGPNTRKYFPGNNQSDFRISGPRRRISYGHVMNFPCISRSSTNWSNEHEALSGIQNIISQMVYSLCVGLRILNVERMGVKPSEDIFEILRLIKGDAYES